MDYSFKPKPVEYNGTEFRSKLEASWAVFFDLCGWDYVYEPEEFDGWMPDFVLIGNDGDRVWVEVKPIPFSPDLYPIPPYIQKVMDKIEVATQHTADEILLLGYEPTDGCIGWLGQALYGCLECPTGAHCSNAGIVPCFYTEDTGDAEDPPHTSITLGREWASAAFGQWEKAQRPGFCSDTGVFFDRMSGEYDGGCFGAGKLKHNLSELWVEVRMRLQYMPRRRPRRDIGTFSKYRKR